MISLKDFIKEKDYINAILSSWIILFIMFIYVLISGNHIEIRVENQYIIKIFDFIESVFILDLLIRFATYYISGIITTYAILRKKIFSYKPIIISIMIFSIWLIKTIFIKYSIVNYIDLLYFLSLIFFIPKKWYRVIKGIILVLIFTMISSFVKSVFIPNVDFNNLPTIFGSIFMIDVILFELIYYYYSMYRKENEDGKLGLVFWKNKILENIKHCITNITSYCNRIHSLSFSEIRKIYCQFLFFILTYGTLLILGIIFNRWIEISVSIMLFHVFRGKENDTFHSSNNIKCFVISITVFIIIMRTAMPIHITYIISVYTSIILCLIMRLVFAIIKLLKIDFKGTKNKRQKIISILGENNLNEEYIEELCIKMGLNNKISETVYLYLNNKIDDVSSILEIDNATVTRRINTFIKNSMKNNI